MWSFWLRNSVIINSKGVIIRDFGPNHDASKNETLFNQSYFYVWLTTLFKSERKSDSVKPKLDNVKPGAYWGFQKVRKH